ncbi:hypothetical protein L6Q96_10620 [Candidatus Binatia bacterium]|nr:hypothetical protein [Candidatus Binatia bacterium]
MPPEVTANPGLLKVDLAWHGVTLSPGLAASAATVCGPPTRSDGTLGVELQLHDDVWVNAPVVDPVAGSSPFALEGVDTRADLRRDGAVVPGRLVAPPEFYGRRTTSGRLLAEVARVQGTCVVVNPRGSCGMALRGGPCILCTEGGVRSPDDLFPFSPEEVTEAVGAAFEEGVAEFVYFNIGPFEGPDAGIAFLEPYVRAVKRHFDTLVAVQMHPPTEHGWIHRTYAMGVDAISYNLEAYAAGAFAAYCPGRAGRIGRARILDALGHAAVVFPSGTVWTDLAVGLEPPESTTAGIDALVAAGVVPVLVLARAALRSRGQTASGLAPVYTHLFHAVRRARINMGWLRDMSFAVTPLEARFFAGDEARAEVRRQQFYRSWLGTLATRNLARLRRQLRVRTASESFDSSHL